jgi:hypothetical protein
VVPKVGLLDAGAATLGGGDGVGFAASGGRECWPASSAVWAAGFQRPDGAACGPFRRPSASDLGDLRPRPVKLSFPDQICDLAGWMVVG